MAIVIPIFFLIIISIGIVVFIFLRKKRENRPSVPPASTGIYVTSYSDPEPAQYYEIPEPAYIN